MDGRLLSETFVELTDTMVAGFDVIDFLHVLTDRSVKLLDVSAALPRTQTTLSPRPSSRSSTCVGCGPAAMSPVSTIRSARCRSGSASTASSAGMTPWMSDRTATELTIVSACQNSPRRAVRRC